MGSKAAVVPDTCRVLVADDDLATLLLYRAALGQSSGVEGGVREGGAGSVRGKVGQCPAAEAAPTSEKSDDANRPASEEAGAAGARPCFEIVQCRQAEEAVETVKQAIADVEPFAVAFLDVVMPPGPDGVWAAEQIRAADPDLQIILVTAQTSIDPEDVARRIPPRDKLLYMHKPLDPLELQSLAAAFTSKWRVERLVEEYQRDLEQRVEERTAELARVNEQLNRDIIERRRIEEALRKSEASLARAQRMARLGSWEVDLDTDEFRCSEETTRILGRSPNDPPLTVNTLLDAVHPDDRSQLEEWLTSGIGQEPIFSMEHRLLQASGSERIVHQLVVVAYDSVDGRPGELRGAIQDITELKRSEEQIVYQAFHDALTGLPNRRLFNDRLQIAIAQARRRSLQLAVLFLDLDDFKTVNDSLGHKQGDLLLQAVAQRLVCAVREEDTVARVGGDEFLVLLMDVSDPSFAVQVAKRMLQAVARPFPFEDRELFSGVSIGITLFPDDADTADGLISNADIAMYRAKEHGRNTYKLFTPAMNLMVMERISLELSLRKALQNKEFQLHYQPMVDIATGQLVGVEALLRWHRPGFGMVGPASFIPLAEETGLIVPIGEWVLRTACRATRRWRDEGLDHLVVSVNLSPRQFQLANLVNMVEQVLDDTGLPAGCLELEVTEDAVMYNVEAAIRIMETLTGIGVRLSMDDFGRGYSSLCHLKRFPMNTLKIDQSFIAELTSSPDDESIVRAIISLSRSLNLKVIAEGVETSEQLDLLKHHDCDQVQGFLFGRPAPAEEIVKTLRRSNGDGHRGE